MTYTIAARCTDGVVLISDRKHLQGFRHTYKTKLADILPSVVITGSGSAGLTNRLSEEIKREESMGRLPNHDKLLEYVEDRSHEMYDRYTKLDDFKMLIGTHDGRQACLYKIYPAKKYAELQKQYVAIGTGAKYGILLLRTFWHEKLSMREFAKVATMCINYVIDSGLDDSVGGDTDVWFIPDAFIPNSGIEQPDNHCMRKATDAELKKMKDFSDDKLTKLFSFLQELKLEKTVVDNGYIIKD